MPIQIPATLEQRISKAGKPYNVIVLRITDTVEKFVFLTASEQALIELNYGK